MRAYGEQNQVSTGTPNTADAEKVRTAPTTRKFNAHTLVFFKLCILALYVLLKGQDVILTILFVKYGQKAYQFHQRWLEEEILLDYRGLSVVA
jgi:hypothetical protein